MQIIGITWTLGAGKGTIVEYLQQKGFLHYSVSGFLKNSIVEQWLPVNRDSMRQVADNLRKQFWPWYLVEELYKIAEKNNTNCVIESIRTLWEIKTLKGKVNFKLWAIDADQNIRYQRILKRKSEKDHISFEKFQAQEQAELDNTQAHQMNILGCIKKADVLFDNNWNIEDLHHQINKTLSQAK